MSRKSLGRLPVAAATAVAVALALGMGLWLRAQDLLADPVMAAEDPFTHMSLVREHLRDGVLQAQTPQGALYPPGLHAVLAAMWVYSGADLYEVMRWAPVVFGAVAIVGVALLLYRWEGPLAAFAGAFAFAAMPEVIHRTTMMSPTALDLALLPLFVGSVLELLRGRLAWFVPAAVVAVFLALAHPWLLAIVTLGGVFFVVLYLAFPWKAPRGPPLTREGIAAAVAILGGTLGVAIATRWEASGTGFSELTLPLTGHNLGMLGIAGVVVALLVAAAVWFLPRMVRYRLPALNRRPNPTAVQVVGAVLLGLGVLAVGWPAVEQGMPPLVDLPINLGWPVLLLAFVGVVLVPLAGGPAHHAGAAWFLATFPFVVHNPLESPYWSHRTIVFLAFGVALLAACAVQRIADGLGPRVLAWLPSRRPRSASAARPAAMALVVPALLVGSAYGGVLLAEMPAPYEGGWYRYYNQCEFDQLRAVAERAQKDPKALVVTGSWQSQLVVAAFTDGADRVWFKQELFTPRYDHANFAALRQREGRHTLVVVDRYLPQEVQGATWDFLAQPPWVQTVQACQGQGEMTWKFTLYELRP